MVAGGSRSVQLVPPHHAGTAARGKSHSCPVSETPLDLLLDIPDSVLFRAQWTSRLGHIASDVGLGQMWNIQWLSGAGIMGTVFIFISLSESLFTVEFLCLENCLVT